MNPLPTFHPGDIVSYCDIEAVVVRDADSNVYVDIPGEGFCKWYKVFEGEPVRLVKRGGLTT